MMKSRSKKMCGHVVSVNQRSDFANCILFATFWSMGTLVRRKKTWRYRAQKVMEFGQLMIDILVYVSCRFEMYILKIAQVKRKCTYCFSLCTEYINLMHRHGEKINHVLIHCSKDLKEHRSMFPYIAMLKTPS